MAHLLFHWCLYFLSRGELYDSFWLADCISCLLPNTLLQLDIGPNLDKFPITQITPNISWLATSEKTLFANFAVFVALFTLFYLCLTDSVFLCLSVSVCVCVRESVQNINL